MLLPLLLNLDMFTIGGGVTYRVVAAGAFAPGAVIGTAFAPGATTLDAFAPGLISGGSAP